MSFYDSLGVVPIINASETYTNLGGSLMDPITLEAMREAAGAFVDMNRLMDAVCERAALLTRNDAAFVTTGAAGGLMLSTAACMCGENEALLDQLPDTSALTRTNVLIYDGPFRQMIPYWRLPRMVGAQVVPVQPSIAAMKAAIDNHTAAVLLFPGTPYERDVPSCEKTIAALKNSGVPIIVDAAAQLPPATNLSYYTRALGADLAVFSGGKHIRGPQSTGLIVGRPDLIRACRLAASPNPRIGRALKTGKEDLAGFITALETFVNTDEAKRYNRQVAILDRIASILDKRAPLVSVEKVAKGRLGTEQPLLHVTLPDYLTGEACNVYTRGTHLPPVDVGVYPPEFGMPRNLIFVNAYNLRESEAEDVAEAIIDFLG